MSTHRFVCLLNHAYKLLSASVLQRLVKETEESLPPSQAGFRKDHGCRDNVLILVTFFDYCLANGARLVNNFVDLVAAFDTVSHSALDVAMQAQGASDKSRAMIRAIYRGASAVVRVSDRGGEKVLSDTFGIGRGVLQGDLLSPRLYIIVGAFIKSRYDPGGGVWLCDLLLHMHSRVCR